MWTVSKVLFGIGAMLGVGLTIAGLCLHFLLPSYIESLMASRYVLNNGSESYAIWEKTVLPLDFQVYLFNVTNPTAIQNGGKPILKQMGPYSFKQYREKYDIEFVDTEDTVSFRQRKTFYFSPELTNGQLNDTITMLNVPLLTVTKHARYLPGNMLFLLNLLIKFYRSQPFVTRTVDEFLFRGYQDDLLKFLAEYQNRTLLPNNTFGFLYGKNGSSEESFDIMRGNRDIGDFGKIVHFRKAPKLVTWNDPYCDLINGTDGSAFHPFVKKGEKLYMFSSEICRSLYMAYSGETVIHGIPLFSYRAPPKLLQSPLKNPDNKCFCPESDKCNGGGMMNITRCSGGAPTFASFPHFYLADERYLWQVQGLQPNASLHESFMDLEPLTGIVMNVAKRVQINADLDPVKDIAGYEKMPRIVFPLLWIYEGAAINDVNADRFKTKVVKPLQLAMATVYTIFGTGCLIILALVIYVLSGCQKNRSKELRQRKFLLLDNWIAEKLLRRSGGQKRVDI